MNVRSCVGGICAIALASLAASGQTTEPAAKKTDPPNPYGLPLNIEIGPGKLNLAAQLRLRYEWYEGFDMQTYAPDANDEALGEKLWLDFDYRVGERFRAFLRLQDARFWLSNYDADDFYPPHSSHENPLDIGQAYLDARQIAGSGLGIRAGRQKIAYADHRVWGPGEWCNSGTFAWDAVKLSWRNPVADVDAIYGKRVVADPDKLDDDHFDFNAWGLYASIKQLPLQLDLFYILKEDSKKQTGGESGTNSLALHAVGFRSEWKPTERTGIAATVARQFGDWGDDDIQAWGMTAAASYQPPAPWKPTLKAGYSYASGDSNPRDGARETFDAMFSAAHNHNGMMDLVTWSNLHDYEAGVTVKPGFADKVSLGYHYFQLAEAEDAWYHGREKKKARDKKGLSGTELGHEVDWHLSKKVTGNVSVEIGYGHFFAGDFPKNTRDGKDADWAYLQTVFSL